MIREYERGEAVFTIEEVTDAREASRVRDCLERSRRNWRWLESHWQDFLPHGRGKYVVVAGEEGTLAASAEEAWTWADRTHPEDDGVVLRYIPEQQGPRIYASQWRLGRP